MFSSKTLKSKFSKVSAKTLNLAGSEYLRSQNEKKIKLEKLYSYEKLKTPTSIRLLHLHQGEKTDVISCELTEVDLNSKPEYDALSYTWLLESEVNMPPEQTEERPILVNGLTLHVTMSLYQALLQFRSQENIPALWADQICMNQQDNAEKIAQLAIMADIYKSASQVRIWLGKRTSTGSRQIDALTEITENTSEDVNDPLKQYSRTPTDELLKKPSITAKVRQAANSVGSFVNIFYQVVAYEDTANFIANRWFRRAWTLQELMLARKFTFCLGPSEIDLDLISASGDKLQQFVQHSVMLPLAYGEPSLTAFLPDRAHLRAIALLAQEQKRVQNGKRYNAEEYLYVIRQRDAAVPKDKVFAGAALLQPDLPSTITYNMTTRDVFISFATSCLWTEIGAQALALVGGGSTVIENFPSWVPDLSTPLQPEPLRVCGGPVFDFLAGPEKSTYEIQDGILRIKAAKWSTVVATAESSWSWRRYAHEPFDHGERGHMRTPSPVINERFGLMFDLFNEIGIAYPPTGERTLDVLWQILIAGVKLSTEEELTAWRTRFTSWFAYTITAIKASIYWEMNPGIQNIAGGKAGKRKWMIPLVADRFDMEARLAKFLDMHDHDPADPNKQPIRETVAMGEKKIFGEKLESMSLWQQAGGHWLMGFDVHLLKPVTEFLHRFKTGYEDRRVLKTQNGYLGSSIEGARVGDVICLVAGTDAPLVLRPVAGQEDSYALVGEAYIHGIMNGQVLKSEDLKWRDIRIL